MKIILVQIQTENEYKLFLRKWKRKNLEVEKQLWETLKKIY